MSASSNHDHEAFLGKVRAWFASGRRPGVVLPTGWFGRPYDNQHELTWAAAHGDRMFLELDDSQLLMIVGRPVAHVSEAELKIDGFDHVVWDWQQYSGTKRGVETFAQGEVRFVDVAASIDVAESRIASSPPPDDELDWINPH